MNDIVNHCSSESKSCLNSFLPLDKDKTAKTKTNANKPGGQCKSLKSTSRPLDPGSDVGSDVGSNVGSDVGSDVGTVVGWVAGRGGR